MTKPLATLFLLAAASIGASGCAGDSPRNRRRLAEAAGEGNHKRLVRLLEGGVSPDGMDEWNNTALALAAHGCDMTSVSALLQKRANPNLVAEHGTAPPLSNLVAHEDTPRQSWCPDGPAIGEMLLRAGANVNGGIEECATPLHRAASPEAVEFLIAHHAELNACGGRSPIASSLARRPKALEAYLKDGGNADAMDRARKTALHDLTENQGLGSEHLDAIRVLLKYNANPNLLDESGFTPLDNAFRCNFKEAVALLKEHGAKWGHELPHDPAMFAKAVERAEGILEQASQICQHTCTFSVVGDNMATGGTDSSWAIIQGTTGVITARCPDYGYLHYIVRTSNLKASLPRKLNLPISGQASFPITFNEEWRNGQMLWFLSKKPTDDLILAIEQSQAQCAGKVDLTVAPVNGRTVGPAKKRPRE